LLKLWQCRSEHKYTTFPFEGDIAKMLFQMGFKTCFGIRAISENALSVVDCHQLASKAIVVGGITQNGCTEQYALGIDNAQETQFVEPADIAGQEKARRALHYSSTTVRDVANG